MKNYEFFKEKTVSATELHGILEKSGMKFEIPIDIEKLIKYLDIPINTRPDFTKIKVLGSISVKDNEPVIWINKIANQMEERKRFTLAHELGHYMLHIAPLSSWDDTIFIDEKIGFNRDDEWDYREMEANGFAAQLLMPAEAVRNEFPVEYKEHSEKATEVLAETFNVSKMAMKYRLESLGLI